MTKRLPTTHTSWAEHGDWYTNTIQNKNSFHQNVILPNLLRLMSIAKEDSIVDIGCGDGFFDAAFVDAGAKQVTGIDAAEDLIIIARERKLKNTLFVVGDARNLSPIPTHSATCVVAILSLQNIDDVSSVIDESARILAPHGRMYWVLNHPCFRIPKSTHWEWTEDKKIQFRRVDSYLSEQRISVDMHPGRTKKQTTLSFHRPLQWYTKILAKHGFSITKMEEWISHRQGPNGATFAALEHARKEIPLFLCVESKKI